MNTENMETFELDHMTWIYFEVRRKTGSEICNRIHKKVGLPVRLLEGGQDQLKSWGGILLEGNIYLKGSDDITIDDDEVTLVVRDGDRKQVIYLTPIYENKCQQPEGVCCT